MLWYFGVCMFDIGVLLVGWLNFLPGSDSGSSFSSRSSLSKVLLAEESLDPEHSSFSFTLSFFSSFSLRSPFPVFNRVGGSLHSLPRSRGEAMLIEGHMVHARPGQGMGYGDIYTLLINGWVDGEGACVWGKNKWESSRIHQDYQDRKL